MEHYAVFGFPIHHSLSPQIHTLFAQQTGQSNFKYTAQAVPADDFETAVNAFFKAGGKGLNCTVPLKELAYQLADVKSERAEASKAVNTLIRQNDGSIAGDNTDGIGLVRDLVNNHAIELQNRDILILGAGGACRGIILPLLAQGARLTIANRTAARAIQLAAEFSNEEHSINGSGFDELQASQFDLILNATAASLAGETPPLPESILKPGGSCYDLAYGREPTAFMKFAEKLRPEKNLDGLGMLVEQAAEAFYLWRQVRPETKPVIQAIMQLALGETG